MELYDQKIREQRICIRCLWWKFNSFLSLVNIDQTRWTRSRILTDNICFVSISNANLDVADTISTPDQ